MKRIYITHCSAKKNLLIEGTTTRVTPSELYSATPIQRFMRKCTERGVEWAIFSDKYGVWFSRDKHEFYDKDPNTIEIGSDEFNRLVGDFDRKLRSYGEIWFYHNPGRFHRLYRGLLSTTTLRDKVRLFTHLSEIS